MGRRIASASTADDAVERLAGCGLPSDVAGQVWSFIEEEVCKPLAPRAVLVGGSRGQRLDNRYSDIDLVALVGPTVTGDVVAATFDGRDINVTAVTDRELDQHAARLRQPGVPAEGAVDVAHGIASNVRRVLDLTDSVVVFGDEAVAQAREMLSRERLARLLVESLAVFVGKDFRDAAGAAASGDWATSAGSAAIAIERATEARLASVGDCYVSRKFLNRRLERVDRPLAELVGRAQAQLASTRGHCEPVVTRNLYLAAALMASALFEAPFAATSRVVRRGPRRSPYHSIARFVDGYAIVGASDHAVTQASAEAWLAHDGRPRAAAVSELAARWGREPAKVGPFFDAVTRDLGAAGLIHDSA